MATIIQQQWIRFNSDGTLDIIHSSGTFTDPNAISSWAEQNVITNRRFRPSNRGNGEYEIRAVMTGPSTNVSNPIANWTSADTNPNITMQVRRLDTDPAGVTQQSNAFNLYVRKKNNINDQVNGSIVLNNILRTEGSAAPVPNTGAWDGREVSSFAEGNASGTQGYFSASRFALWGTGVMNEQTNGFGWFGPLTTNINVGSWLPAGTSVSDWEGRISSALITLDRNENNTSFPDSTPTAWASMSNGLFMSVQANQGFASSHATRSVVFTIQIRRISNPSVVVEGSVTLTALLSL